MSDGSKMSFCDFPNFTLVGLPMVYKGPVHTSASYAAKAPSPEKGHPTHHSPSSIINKNHDHKWLNPSYVSVTEISVRINSVHLSDCAVMFWQYLPHSHEKHEALTHRMACPESPNATSVSESRAISRALTLHNTIITSLASYQILYYK